MRTSIPAIFALVLSFASVTFAVPTAGGAIAARDQWSGISQGGQTGAGTLDKVAGPVGEALIMTGVGLAVAIPAVMAYNWLTRSNRVWGARLDAFAFELFAFLSTGQTLKNSTDAEPGRAPAAVVPMKSQA